MRAESTRSTAYSLRVESVVGREAELALVDAYLAGEPTGRTLVIVGEPGIGKTTMWSEAVARARGREATVLVARPSESEAKLAFAGLADLLAGAPEARLAALPAPQRDALEVALLRMPARRPPERRLVGTALLSLGAVKVLMPPAPAANSRSVLSGMTTRPRPLFPCQPVATVEVPTAFPAGESRVSKIDVGELPHATGAVSAGRARLEDLPDPP